MSDPEHSKHVALNLEVNEAGEWVVAEPFPRCRSVLADDVAQCEKLKDHDGDHGACLSYVEVDQDTGDSGLVTGDCLDWVEWE